MHKIIVSNFVRYDKRCDFCWSLYSSFVSLSLRTNDLVLLISSMLIYEGQSCLIMTNLMIFSDGYNTYLKSFGIIVIERWAKRSLKLTAYEL